MVLRAHTKKRIPCALVGFTLIELIVVLTIIAIMTAAVVPLYRGSISWVRGDRAARDVVAVMKFAQERAVTDATEYRFYLDADKGRYWLMRQDGGRPSVDGASRPVPQTRRDGSSTRGDKLFKDVGDVAGGRRRLPEGTKLKGIDARFDAEENAYYVAFHPSGACDYASVELHRADKKVTRIETKGRLGQFEVTER